MTGGIIQDIKHRAVGFRVHLPWPGDADQTTPQELDIACCPRQCARRRWIPQTMGDQVWIVYEFETAEEKEAYLAQLPERFRKFLDDAVIRW